ncbi:aromatic acid/H+ symport family MFS transporter [Pseudomonas aeruginosa]|uniref:MFS transporter n=1 Tax=Pseudomonas aeruginosa TaxID=287 RepID=UPI002F91BAE7
MQKALGSRIVESDELRLASFDFVGYDDVSCLNARYPFTRCNPSPDNENNTRSNNMKVDISKVFAETKLGRYHIAVLALCFLIVTIDGYDLVVMGVALPAIMSEMNMSTEVAGIIASSALVGMMVGAIFMGTLADRIGRIKTIAVCIALFSVFTAMIGFVRTPEALAALRLIAGIGLGGVIPCIAATTGEYSPKHLRARMMTIMLSGYPLGGVMAALLGKQMIQAYGWQSVFFVAGAALLLLPAVFKLLPESPAILYKRGDKRALRKLVECFAPRRPISDLDEIYLPIPGNPAKTPVRLLFHDNRCFSTLLLWLSCFCGLFLLYGLNAWLPKLMALAGYSLDAALTLLLLMNIGCIIGSLMGGWLSDHFGLKRVMVIMLLGGAIAIPLLGEDLPAGLVSIVIFVVGMSAAGVQGVANAYISQFYPAGTRATGLGMALGVGRLGGIASPMVIGLLLALHLPVQCVLYMIAGFSILQAIAIWLVDDQVADLASPCVEKERSAEAL